MFPSRVHLSFQPQEWVSLSLSTDNTGLKSLHQIVLYFLLSSQFITSRYSTRSWGKRFPADGQHLYLAEDSLPCTFWICWQETCSRSNQSPRKIDFCSLLAYGIESGKTLISQTNLNYLEAIIARLQIIRIPPFF